MYLNWVLALILFISKVINAYEQHCIDPANCQFYPVHRCYATEVGLVCRNRNAGGYEMSIDLLYTFSYEPFHIKNDTGLPCSTIPVTDELINYVDIKGSKVINVDDLDLIGNCSRMSYCDKHSRTCQPKRPFGSQCTYNMHCYFGIDGYPGHCTNHTCTAREDIPQYYYNTPRWTMGDQWQAAVIAVLITGGIAIVLIVGRVQVKKLVNKFKQLMEKWQNPDTSPPPLIRQQQPLTFIENEQVWNEHHHKQKWWKQVPGMNWVYSRLKRGNDSNEQYYQLNTRGDDGPIDQPPPYRAD